MACTAVSASCNLDKAKARGISFISDFKLKIFYLRAVKKHWQKWSQSAWFRFLSNRYVLVMLGFLIWMGFFDLNSWLIHRGLNQEKESLEESIEYYQEQLAHDRQRLQELNDDPASLEKFAREQFFLVREGERVYLIKDSLE